MAEVLKMDLFFLLWNLYLIASIDVLFVYEPI